MTSQIISRDVVVDLVTVTFSGEIQSFLLQARSVDLFFDFDVLGRYIVVWNDTAPVEELHAQISGLPPRLLDRIEIHSASDVREVAGRAKGWLVQQVLKLQAVASSKAPFVLVLDSKNHLISPISFDDLVSKDGLPITRSMNYMNKAAFRALLEGGMDYFGVEKTEEALSFALPTTTPNMMISAVVRDMLKNIEDREGSFADAFFNGNLRYISTEFLLYYSYIVYSGAPLKSIYAFSPENAITFFKSSPKDEPGIKMALGRLARPSTKFLAVHRVRLSRLSELERESFSQLWLDRGLFNSQDDIEEFIGSFDGAGK
ncbi:MAG: hypothetical protein EOP06_09120 [Proteobacteria bacterium]|nr:MAG: hypothetical protein EOP06_09120 [Pseudomonadota bacterium]